LHNVLTPQLFLEVRSFDRDTTVERSNLGSLSVDSSTGERNLPFLGLTSVSDPETSTDPTFVSFVLPLAQAIGGRGFAIAGSRQVVLSEDRSLASGSEATEARFSFPSFPNTVNGSTVEAYSVETLVSGGRSAEIVFWNVGASIDLTQDFSAGLTLTYATLDLASETRTQVVDPLQLFLDPTHPRFPAQPSVDVYRTIAQGTDSDVTFTFGIHLHPDSVFASGHSPWSFGAVYRKGADFAVRETTFLNGIPSGAFDTTFVVPDRYALAAGFRPAERWLVSLELERVEYSDLLEGFRSGVNYLTSGQVAGGAFGIDPNRSVEFTADDGLIPRLGVEYLAPQASGKIGWAVWGGYYHTPDDRIRMSHFNSDDTSVNAAYREAFRGGEPADHLTGGFGLEVGSSSFRFAGETSSEERQFVGTYTYRFRNGR
jgi:hypothetical protein